MIDFGKTAEDYDQHRPGFPESMFERLVLRGWIAGGMRALDLGTGTGSLALELAANGLMVVGLDPSAALLAIARRRASERRLAIPFIEGVAEDTGQKDASFDLVTAGQCWWWFNAETAVAETKRILQPRGRLLIANFCYLPVVGSVAERTERLVLQHNPGWAKAGECGIFEHQIRALDAGGFREVESLSYVEPVAFTHQRWRGRIRSCNGVGAALEPEKVEAFDRDLAAMLAAEFPAELCVPHRVFVATARL